MDDRVEPVIGKNVLMSSGAKVQGKIIIGITVLIDANSVVFSEVLDNL